MYFSIVKINTIDFLDNYLNYNLREQKNNIYLIYYTT